jgi:hypothetical protein
MRPLIRKYIYMNRFVRNLIHTLTGPPFTTAAIILTAIVCMIYLA